MATMKVAEVPKAEADFRIVDSKATKAAEEKAAEACVRMLSGHAQFRVVLTML
jgi:hypothetical protein